MSIKRIAEAIERYNKYLIIAHVGLEGDSIGSQFAFLRLLRSLGKDGVVVNESAPSPQYDFMGVKGEVITDKKKKVDYEAAAIIDCPVIKRIGKASKFLAMGKPIINIDHHISNTSFGDVNWVEPHLSSCGEMIYELYKAMNVPIDKKTALLLYVAILTDTGSFAYESTTAKTHTIASELLSKGLNPNAIYQALYENRSIAEVRLLENALSTMKLAGDGKVGYMHVSKEMLRKNKVGVEVTEGFVNYARSINGIKVGIIFLEDPCDKGKIDISFRSKGAVNVNKLASLFGGGGHKNASGCVVEGGLKAVMKKVLAAAEKSV